MMSAMKRYNLYLSKYQIEVLEQVSQQKGISVSELIRRALDEYIERHRLDNYIAQSNLAMEKDNVSD